MSFSSNMSFNICENVECLLTSFQNSVKLFFMFSNMASYPCVRSQMGPVICGLPVRMPSNCYINVGIHDQDIISFPDYPRGSMTVQLIKQNDVTDFYPVSMTVQVDMREWMPPRRRQRQKQGEVSGYVAVSRTNGSMKRTFHCAFFQNKRALAQVICRHLGYRMAVPMATDVSINPNRICQKNCKLFIPSFH